MALVQIDHTSPRFTALSTDIGLDNKIPTLGYEGAIVYLTDITTGNPRRIVNHDLTLSEYLGDSVNANIISSTPLSVTIDPNITLNTNIISSTPLSTNDYVQNIKLSNMLGENNFNYIGDTSAHIPGTGYVFVALQVISDTVFAAILPAPEGTTFTGVAISSGTTIFGKFTSITLTSGKVIAYKGV